MLKVKKNITCKLNATFLIAALLVINVPVVIADTHDSQPVSSTVTAETGADGVQRVEITLDSYSFTPSHIIVEHGKPVEFTLINVASVAPHNFHVDASADGLYLDADVEPGKTATLSFLPVKSGVYDFYCDKQLLFLPSHKEKGMVGKLEVH